MEYHTEALISTIMLKAKLFSINGCIHRNPVYVHACHTPKAEKPPAVSVIEKFCALYPVLISGNKYMQLHLQHQKLRVQAESTVFRNLL